MALLLHQLPKLHWQTKKKIDKMALFVVFGYLIAWFTAPCLTSAASNDLILYNGGGKFKKIHKKISDKTSALLNRHTWYLTEELIPFSLFNDVVPLETRSLLAKKIHEQSARGELEIRKPTLPLINGTSEILHFVGEQSKLLFDLLGISTDFLQTEEWHLSTEYDTCKDALKNLSATNDSAERAISLATEFNTTITRDEESHQELLQVVEFHRKTFKCNTKDNLKKFM